MLEKPGSFDKDATARLPSEEATVGKGTAVGVGQQLPTHAQTERQVASV